MYLYLLRIHYKKIRKGLIWWWLCDFFSDFLYKGICCGYSFELHRQVDAIQMRTHNICLYKKVNKKYTGCNLKTTEFHECALIGVCAVIRSNTVGWSDYAFCIWQSSGLPQQPSVIAMSCLVSRCNIGFGFSACLSIHSFLHSSNN